MPLLTVPIIVGLSYGITALGMGDMRRRCKSPPPPIPPPTVKHRVVPNDWLVKIKYHFNEMEQYKEKYGDGARPAVAIDALQLGLIWEIKNFPLMDNPSKFIPDNFEEEITDLIRLMAERFAINGVNVDYVVDLFYKDICRKIEDWM
jgi:hypothetical protein